MARNSTTTLFKNHSFLSLWGAQVLTQLGTNMLSFVLALRIFKMTRSNMAVAVLMLMVGLATLLFGALAGVLVDRWEKKQVLLAVNFIRFLMLLLFIFVLQSPPQMIALAFVFTVVTQFFIPAEGAIVPNLVDGRALLSANSLFTFTLYASIILGFVGSGPALKIFGARGVFIFIAFLFFLATFLVSFIPPHLSLLVKVLNGFKAMLKPRLSSAFSGIGFFFIPWRRFTHLGEVKEELKEGLIFIRERPLVLDSILLLAFSQVIIAVLLALSPGFAAEVLRIEIEDASIIIMLPAALGMVLGALTLARWGSCFSRWALKFFGLSSLSITLLLIFFVQKFSFFLLPFSIFLLFLLGVENSLVNVPSQTILQEETDFGMRGRVYGVLSTAVSAVSALPVVTAGFLADIIGVGWVIFLLGAMVLFVTTLFRWRQMKVYCKV